MAAPKLEVICAHDPSNPGNVGAVFFAKEQRTIDRAAAEGAIFLPLESNLLRMFSLGGFVRRDWGWGWPMSLNRPESAAPTVLQVRAGDSQIHWVAELGTPEGYPARGKVQLALTRNAAGALAPGFSQVAQPDAFELKKDATLIVRGTAQLNTLIDGFVALHLWGTCSNVRVYWMAVSQSGLL